MTAPEYRNRGLIRLLMAEVEKDFGPVADGFYLFGHSGVRDFYPQFGFLPLGGETVYSRPLPAAAPADWEQVPMNTTERHAALWAAIQHSRFCGGFDLVNNPGLVMFYAGQFLTDCVYYSKRLNAWVIAEPDADVLTLHNVFSPDPALALDAVADALGGLCPGCTTLTLGFAPADPAGWVPALVAEPDTILMGKGRFFAQGGYFFACCHGITSGEYYISCG